MKDETEVTSLQREIVRQSQTHPERTQMEIAEAVGCSLGYVSDTLNKAKQQAISMENPPLIGCDESSLGDENIHEKDWMAIVNALLETGNDDLARRISREVSSVEPHKAEKRPGIA